MTETKRREKINEAIKQIRKDFRIKYGVTICIVPYKEIRTEGIQGKTLQDIYYVIRDNYNVDIKSKTRKIENMTAKQVFCKITRDLGYAYQSIGRFLGNDHSTVISHCKRTRNLLEINDYRITKMYNDVMKKLDAE